MNFVLMYFFARISFVFAAWPPTIDSRLPGITKINIQIESEVNVHGVALKWFRSVPDIFSEFVATAHTTRLIIKEESIYEVLEDIKKKAKAEIQAAVKDDMKKSANANVEKAGMQKATNIATEKAKKLDGRNLAEEVMDHVCRIEFSVVVLSYTRSKGKGRFIVTMPEKTFQDLKMSLPVHSSYNYFKLQDGTNFKDGQMLDFHHKAKDIMYGAAVTNVLKDKEYQVEVARDPLLYKKITLRNNSSIVIDGTFGLTGPYYGCDVTLVPLNT